MLMTAHQCALGSFRMLTIDKRLSPLPCIERVLPRVIAIIAPSTAFCERCTWLLGMQFDYVGTSNCSFCNLTSSEAIFSCFGPPLCFSQHYLSPKLCLPYFAALLPLLPRAPGAPRQKRLALWTVVSSVETVCQFAASLAPFCRDTEVHFPCIPKQKAVAAAADAADDDSAPVLLRPP